MVRPIPITVGFMQSLAEADDHLTIMYKKSLEYVKLDDPILYITFSSPLTFDEAVNFFSNLTVDCGFDKLYRCSFKLLDDTMFMFFYEWGTV